MPRLNREEGVGEGGMCLHVSLDLLMTVDIYLIEVTDKNKIHA